MKRTFKESILNQPISSQELTREFKEVTARHGYRTLGDMLQITKAYDLLNHEDFGYRLLMEFARTLTKNGLGHYLN